MGKTGIVFQPTHLEMIDQNLTRSGIKSIEIFVGKGPQQQLSLVEPTGVGRSKQNPKLRVVLKIGVSMMINMGRSIVQNQMNAVTGSKAACQLTHRPQKVLMVIASQARSPHRSIKHIEGYQKDHGSVSLVFKLTALNLPTSHRVRGGTSRKRLNVGFFIHTQDHLPTLEQPFHPLVTPQDFRGPRDKSLIKLSGFPQPASVRVQRGSRQYPRDCRVMNRIDNSGFNHHLLQAPTIPTAQFQPLAQWFGAGQFFDLDLLQRGKNGVDAHSAPHQIPLRLHVLDTFATNTTASFDSLQTNRQYRQSALLGPLPTTIAPDWQFVGLSARHQRFGANTHDLLPSNCIRSVCVLSFRVSPPHLNCNVKQTLFQFVQKLTLQSISG
jgi:hypothetical protein